MDGSSLSLCVSQFFLKRGLFKAAQFISYDRVNLWCELSKRNTLSDSIHCQNVKSVFSFPNVDSISDGQHSAVEIPPKRMTPRTSCISWTKDATHRDCCKVACKRAAIYHLLCTQISQTKLCKGASKSSWKFALKQIYFCYEKMLKSCSFFLMFFH